MDLRSGSNRRSRPVANSSSSPERGPPLGHAGRRPGMSEGVRSGQHPRWAHESNTFVEPAVHRGERIAGPPEQAVDREPFRDLAIPHEARTGSGWRSRRDWQYPTPRAPAVRTVHDAVLCSSFSVPARVCASELPPVLTYEKSAVNFVRSLGGFVLGQRQGPDSIPTVMTLTHSARNHCRTPSPETIHSHSFPADGVPPGNRFCLFGFPGALGSTSGGCRGVIGYVRSPLLQTQQDREERGQADHHQDHRQHQKRRPATLLGRRSPRTPVR
jgi:hypothetical protein